MSRIDHYLEQLNEPQREAVLENSRPQLVLAGAGSGKTRVITTKIAYAIEVLGYDTSEILAVTFTNRAAKEMKERLIQMLPSRDLSFMQVRTFHSFGAWLLRRYGQSIGLRPSFTIYDDDDSLSLLASLFPAFKRVELSPIAKAISLAKDRGLTPTSKELDSFRYDPLFKEHFAAYEKRLRSIGNVDFADLIMRSIELLKKDTSVRNTLHNRFKMILVDEYQDSNTSQFTLLKELVGKNSFICVVGDDDQSIYRFRGAEVSNILNFPKEYPNTHVVRLEQNYRSTQAILSLATHVIQHNRGRHDKTLWTDKKEGSAIYLHYLEDGKQEATKIGWDIKSHTQYNDSAVIYRTNAQSQLFEAEFARLHIPYKVIGALKFFDREEIKDILALLSLILNPLDEVNFKRMVNKPPRSLGPASVEKIMKTAEEHQLSYVEALIYASDNALLSPKAAQAAKSFALLLQQVEDLLEVDNTQALHKLIGDSGLLAHYAKQDKTNHTFKVDNLSQLVSVISEYPSNREGIVEFLESLTLDPTTLGHKDPADEEGVSLMTMHNTKGLEFKHVYVTGLEEGIFPSYNCESDADYEEERRLFYVAITRAKEELSLYSAQRRTVWGSTRIQEPSRFLAEIDSSLITVNDERRIHQSFTSQNWKPSTSLYGNIQLTPTPTFEQKKERIKGEVVSFSKGDKVKHHQYGEGIVIEEQLLRNKKMIKVSFSQGVNINFFGETDMLTKL